MVVALTVASLAAGVTPGAGAHRNRAEWQAMVARPGELRLRGDWDAAHTLVDAALRAADESKDATARLRLLLELSAIDREVRSYRDARGRTAARARFAEAEALLDGASDASLAAAAEERAWLDYGRAFEGDVTFADVRRSFHEARVLTEQTRDEAGLARAWFGIGLTHQQSGELPEAQAAFRRGLDLAERSGSLVTQGYLQRHLGFVAADLAKDPAVALPYYERSLALRERSGHRWGEVFALTTLGRALADTGDVARARSVLRRAVADGTKLRLTRAVAEAEEALADLEWSSKAGPAACRHLAEAARQWTSFGEPRRKGIETRRAEWACPR